MLVALVMTAGTLQAQRPPQPGEPMERDPRRMQMMREQVEERFGRIIQTELQLSESEMNRVRQSMRANQDRRIALMRREQDLRRAIGGQLEPGQAANNDSLSRMLDGVGRLRVERAESDQQLMRDLAFLPPVKRARLGMMLQRFDERVQDIRERRMAPQRRMRER